jgi:hypothetical protein
MAPSVTPRAAPFRIYGWERIEARLWSLAAGALAALSAGLSARDAPSLDPKVSSHTTTVRSSPSGDQRRSRTPSPPVTAAVRYPEWHHVRARIGRVLEEQSFARSAGEPVVIDVYVDAPWLAAGAAQPSQQDDQRDEED